MAKPVNALLLGAFVLFLIGVFAPLLTFHNLLFFSNTVSLASALVDLVVGRHIGLFAVLFGFSVVLPVFKLFVLYRAWNRTGEKREHLHRCLDWLAHCGKWSMLDVFVVAVLFVAIKLKAIASVEIHIGLYAFAGSVLVTMVVTSRLSQLAKRALSPRSVAGASAR